MEENVEMSEYYDHETGLNYRIMFNRELNWPERAEAVKRFKPWKVLEMNGGEVIMLVVPDPNWLPVA